MTRKTLNDDLPDVSKEELQRLEKVLNNWQPPYPTSSDIDRTIAAARLELQLQNDTKPAPGLRIARLLRLTASELSGFTTLYWVMSLFLYIIGLATLVQFQGEPRFALFALAPVPFLVGLSEVLRSRDTGMLELEMSCRYNGASVMLAKLCITAGYTILLNACAATWFASTYTGLGLGTLMQAWLIPFTLMTAMALAVVMRLRGSNAVMVTLSIWGSCCVLLLFNPGIIERLTTLPYSTGLLAATLGTGLALFLGYRLLQQTYTGKGGDWLEAGY